MRSLRNVALLIQFLIPAAYAQIPVFQTWSPLNATVAQGSNYAFTATVTNTAGPDGAVYFNFEAWPAYEWTCKVGVYPATGRFFLHDDSGDEMWQTAGYLEPAVAPGAVHSNSHCRLLAAGSGVSISGSTATVTVNVSYNAPFLGQKYAWVVARNNAGWSGTNWLLLTGVNFTGTNDAPQTISVLPKDGEGFAQSVSTVVRDRNGAQNIWHVALIIAPASYSYGWDAPANQRCMVVAETNANLFWLQDDNAQIVNPPGFGYAGSPTSASNPRCNLSFAGSSMKYTDSDTLEIEFAVTFNLQTFSGPMKFFTFAVDRTNGADTPIWSGASQASWKVSGAPATSSFSNMSSASTYSLAGHYTDWAWTEDGLVSTTLVASTQAAAGHYIEDMYLKRETASGSRYAEASQFFYTPDASLTVWLNPCNSVLCEDGFFPITASFRERCVIGGLLVAIAAVQTAPSQVVPAYLQLLSVEFLLPMSASTLGRISYRDDNANVRITAAKSPTCPASTASGFAQLVDGSPAATLAGNPPAAGINLNIPLGGLTGTQTFEFKSLANNLIEGNSRVHVTIAPSNNTNPQCPVIGQNPQVATINLAKPILAIEPATAVFPPKQENVPTSTLVLTVRSANGVKIPFNVSVPPQVAPYISVAPASGTIPTTTGPTSQLPITVILDRPNAPLMGTAVITVTPTPPAETQPVSFPVTVSWN